MPQVGNQSFPYTPKGKKDAKKAQERMKKNAKPMPPFMMKKKKKAKK